MNRHNRTQFSQTAIYMLSLSTYRHAFNSSPVGECLLSPEAVVLDVNDAFLKAAARRREDMVGKNVFEVFPGNPDDLNDTGVEALSESLARVLATGLPDTLALQRYPIWIADADGKKNYEERYWSAVNSPIYDEHGKLLCISHSTVDVTAMLDAPGAEGNRIQTHLEANMFSRAQNVQQVNKALKAERSRLHHLFEHAPGFVFFTQGPDHIIEETNDAFLGLVGQRQLIGKTVRDAFPEVAGQGFFELLDEVFRTGQPFIGHALKIGLRISDGGPIKERYVDLVYQPIVDADGTVTGICGQGHDITEKRVIETELRTSAARQAFQLKLADRLRTLSSADEMVATAVEMLGRQMDVKHIIYWEMDEAHGTFLVRGEWTAPGLQSISRHVNQLDEFGPEVMATLRRGGSLIIEDVNTDARTLDCTQAYASVGIRSELAFPLLKSGRLTTVLSLLDSQPRHWATGDIRLSQDVAERTWSAVEGARAQHDLREADLRKDEFLAMLAHELRNPLAPISAAAELMKMVRLNEDLVKQTSLLITRQVSHMTGLVDDLLDVSRVTRGLVSINKSPQDLKAVIANAVEQVRPLMETQGHQLDIDLPASSVQVLGDQKRLVQIFTNLLNNAAKYTLPNGRIQLQMEVQEDRVYLRVLDNGIGIAPELQSRVFDLFSQAERSSDRSQGGLGLGLALVKSLLERHDGTVACYSEGLGKGSCFTVCLPRLAAHEETKANAPADVDTTTVAGRLRILVVDDNVDAAETLAMLLEAAGHDVMVEFGAIAALERARVQMPDACLLDIGLPEVDGNELARRLRAVPELANITLIAVTGYGQEADRRNALAAGFNYHLVKPVDTTTLNKLLSRVSDR